MFLTRKVPQYPLGNIFHILDAPPQIFVSHLIEYLSIPVNGLVEGPLGIDIPVSYALYRFPDKHFIPEQHDMNINKHRAYSFRILKLLLYV